MTDDLLPLIITLAPLVLGCVFIIRSYINHEKINNRIQNLGDTLTYGMPKYLYDYKHAQDLREVYQSPSINKQIWGNPKLSESCFGEWEWVSTPFGGYRRIRR